MVTTFEALSKQKSSICSLCHIKCVGKIDAFIFNITYAPVKPSQMATWLIKDSGISSGIHNNNNQQYRSVKFKLPTISNRYSELDHNLHFQSHLDF